MQLSVRRHQRVPDKKLDHFHSSYKYQAFHPGPALPPCADVESHPTGSISFKYEKKYFESRLDRIVNYKKVLSRHSFCLMKKLLLHQPRLLAL